MQSRAHSPRQSSPTSVMKSSCRQSPTVHSNSRHIDIANKESNVKHVHSLDDICGDLASSYHKFLVAWNASTHKGGACATRIIDYVKRRYLDDGKWWWRLVPNAVWRQLMSSVRARSTAKNHVARARDIKQQAKDSINSTSSVLRELSLISMCLMQFRGTNVLLVFYHLFLWTNLETVKQTFVDGGICRLNKLGDRLR